MLFACCAGGFYLWKYEHKRTQLDKYYASRLSCVLTNQCIAKEILYDPNCHETLRSLCSDDISEADKEVEKIENDMSKDGYDRLEILVAKYQASGL